MEALQLQLLLQQAVFGQSMMAGYNPYASLFTTGATSSSGSSSATNGSAAGMDAATLATLTALMGGPQLSQQLTASPAPSSATSTNTPAASAASSSNSNAAATASLLGMSSTEAALAAELLANPSLFSMLNPSAAMSLNPMQAMTGLDMATLAQLSALGAADSASLNSTPTSTQATTSSATRKPGQQAKGLGKLNAVVEKLASSNSASDQQS
ncbi:hypothetical protein AAVH_03719 [Aphelenchoides avenae]|nr:hypothetical protein AAVH_03719 [Aphelenchus avenae]